MTPFKLTILGCNAALPTSGRFTSMQILNVNHHLFMIDCGEGAQIRIRQYKIKKSKIKCICISHLHGDHVFGLPGLLTSYAHEGRSEPLKVFGPTGIKDFIENILESTQAIINYPLEIIEIDKNEHHEIYRSEAVSIQAFPLDHRIKTYGYVFKEIIPAYNIDKEIFKNFDLSYQQIKDLKSGIDIMVDNQLVPFQKFTLAQAKARSYAYCSDTAYDESILPSIQGVDLLYHETTYLHDLQELALERKHATAKEAGIIARKAEVGKLVLGHYSSRYKKLDAFKVEAEEEFPHVILGYDGVMIEI